MHPRRRPTGTDHPRPAPGPTATVRALSTLTYLLAGDSDRTGNLDFTSSSEVYAPRQAGPATLDDLRQAAERIEAGDPIPPQLEAALLRGSSIGGARPKALLDDGDRELIAKFSSTTDTMPVVQAEFVAMTLARRAGIDAAHVELASSAGGACSWSSASTGSQAPRNAARWCRR